MKRKRNHATLLNKFFVLQQSIIYAQWLPYRQDGMQALSVPVASRADSTSAPVQTALESEPTGGVGVGIRKGNCITPRIGTSCLC